MSRLSNRDLPKSRRQRRQRQKQRHRQEIVRTSAERQKPQLSKQLPTTQRTSNHHLVRKLPRMAAFKSSTPVKAGLKATHTGSANVKSLQKDKRQGVAADKRSVPSPLPTVVKGTSGRSRLRSISPLRYAARLLILGVGIGAIAGTLLSAWDPGSRQPAGASVTAKSKVQKSADPEKPPLPLHLGQEILSLKAQVQALAAKNLKLQPGVFFVDLDTGAYLDLDGGSVFPAASTIKLPILVAVFQDVDAGKIRLDEMLTLEPEMIGTGSGEMQYKKPGSKFTALDTVIKMITISDNTATNMLIARLGGAETLNQRFRSWGLSATTIHNALPDLEGTNTTSPKELANLMAMVNQGEVVSLRSRDRILDIMRQTKTNTLLPRGLGAGATIAHKTGDIGSLVADIGLIDMPIGKRYIAAVMVKRPHNNPAAQELIRQISRTAYQYFSQPILIPGSPTSPSATSAPVIGSVPARNSATDAASFPLKEY